MEAAEIPSELVRRIWRKRRRSGQGRPTEVDATLPRMSSSVAVLRATATHWTCFIVSSALNRSATAVLVLFD
jgi:hypothetical protein